MLHSAIETYIPKSRQDWRKWLQDNHSLKQSVWLVYYKKQSGVPSLSYTDAVEEALCYGWIDSVKKTIDEERFIQFFSRRKSKSVWSKINKEKVQCLIAEGLMTPAGYKSIESAQQNGSWVILDEVEALKIPEDLATAFSASPGSLACFSGLSRSARKAMLQGLVLAKRPDTRQKRIAAIAALVAQKQSPGQ